MGPQEQLVGGLDKKQQNIVVCIKYECFILMVDFHAELMCPQTPQSLQYNIQSIHPLLKIKTRYKKMLKKTVLKYKNSGLSVFPQYNFPSFESNTSIAMDSQGP